MATYAVGDVHGCCRTLRRALDAARFDPAADRLWSVGDLVNRGPRSLDVLRFFRDLGGRARVVLGNHDMHLLARAAGAREAAGRDTLDEVLAAPDRHDLLDWLRRRPFAYREGDWLLVHAGVLPSWEDGEILERARELEEMFHGADWRSAVAELYATPSPPSWHDGLRGASRKRALFDVFARLRTCTAEGAPCAEFTGPPAEAPPGCRPWFELRPGGAATVLFGHWAALGYRREPRAVGLDTGCAWGNLLTLLRLEDGALFQERFRG